MKIWDELPDIPLVVMGGGPLEEEFRQWADGHDNVYFLGFKIIGIITLKNCFPSATT